VQVKKGRCPSPLGLTPPLRSSLTTKTGLMEWVGKITVIQIYEEPLNSILRCKYSYFIGRIKKVFLPILFKRYKFNVIAL
jgi:hypothetical protein